MEKEVFCNANPMVLERNTQHVNQSLGRFQQRQSTSSYAAEFQMVQTPRKWEIFDLLNNLVNSNGQTGIYAAILVPGTDELGRPKSASWQNTRPSRIGQRTAGFGGLLLELASLSRIQTSAHMAS